MESNARQIEKKTPTKKKNTKSQQKSWIGIVVGKRKCKWEAKFTISRIVIEKKTAASAQVYTNQRKHYIHIFGAI